MGRTNTLGPQAAEQGINKAVFREGVVIQMTWTGAPTIYYGDEAGVCGLTDPDNRRTYPWGHEDQVLLSFHKDIIRLRRENEELRTGSLKMLENDYNFISYGRFNRKGQCAILINNNNHPITKEIHVWEIGVPKTGKMKVIRNPEMTDIAWKARSMRSRQEDPDRDAPDFRNDPEVCAGITCRKRYNLPKTERISDVYHHHNPAVAAGILRDLAANMF